MPMYAQGVHGRDSGRTGRTWAYKGVHGRNIAGALGSTNYLSWKSEKIMLKMSFLLHKSHFSKKIVLDFQLRSFVEPKPVEL